MMKFIPLLFVTLFALPCVAEDTMPKAGQQDAKSAQASSGFDWSTITPLDFLSILKDRKGYVMFIETANQPPKDWIKEEHVGQLIRLIGSREPAAPVTSGLGNYLPSSRSTVGNEAMFLIEGFRSGRYPPTICSVYDFKADPEEYKKWWEGWAARAKSEARTSVGALKVIPHGPSREEILKDTKPADLSIVDQTLLRRDVIRIGIARIDVLVSRVTNVVEYLWSPPYGRYIRPKYVLPNVQELYNRTHA